MHRSRTIISIAIAIFISSHCFAQAGRTALTFLTVPPTTEANGMGEASVANPTDDPLAMIMNPAQLGMLSQTNLFSSGYDFTHWIADIRLSTYALNAGISLDKIFSNAPALSIGIGYSRVYFDYGNLQITTAEHPEGTGPSFHSWESSNQYSIGAGYNNWTKVSGGFTVKYIRQALIPSGTGGMPVPTEGSVVAVQGKTRDMGSAKLYDYGFLVDVPVTDIVSKLANQPFTVAPNLLTYLDLSGGFSRSNLGKESISYYDPSLTWPLPRYARAGIGLDLGLVLNKYDQPVKPFSFKWTTEEAEVLVDRNGQYKAGMGDIQFVDDVIMGGTNPAGEKKKGWELNLMEIVSIRGGRFEDGTGFYGRRFNSSGWGFRLSGIPKLLRVLDRPINADGLIGYLVNHLDIRYTHSEWNGDNINNIIRNIKFDSVNLSITN